ncbi:hypothetical protein TWF281_010880 [Arthrobotrys megalospora]
MEAVAGQANGGRSLRITDPDRYNSVKQVLSQHRDGQFSHRYNFVMEIVQLGGYGAGITAPSGIGAWLLSLSKAVIKPVEVVITITTKKGFWGLFGYETVEAFTRTVLCQVANPYAPLAACPWDQPTSCPRATNHGLRKKDKVKEEEKRGRL